MFAEKPILVGTAANEVIIKLKVVPVGSPTGAHFFYNFFKKPIDNRLFLCYTTIRKRAIDPKKRR